MTSSTDSPTALSDTADTAGSDVDAAARNQRAAAILIGAAAHDLRTPLNTMAGWLQVLQSAHDLPPATRERAFKGLQSAVVQQTALADGLAQFAAISADHPALETGSVDVAAALAEALKALGGEAQAKGVELVTQDGGGLRTNTDAALMAALLRHCLTGALKFAAKNCRLLAAVELVGQDGRVRIEIERSLLPAAGIAAILLYSGGTGGEKPNGAGAAFSFGVALGIARFLGGVLSAQQGSGDASVVLLLSFPIR